MREKICEMVSVMRKAASVDDETAERDSEKLTQLVTENKGLKEMLRIHQTLGVSLQEDSEVEQITQTGPSATVTSILEERGAGLVESTTPTPEQMDNEIVSSSTDEDQ